jgi:formylglycine-generating enzyme required for sulfatase activity
MSDLFSRARQVLQPLVATVEERGALLTEAFYSHDPILSSIQREGAPKIFIVNCLRIILDHGFLPTGEHALARLLIVAKYDCGVEKHPEIDELISIANSLDKTPVAKNAEQKPAVLPNDPAPVQTIETPRNDRRPTVFVSYSHNDSEFADKLIADLNIAGHACWIDKSSIKGGDEWIMTIADGILNSYAFVLIATQAALESRWVQDEILWARKKNKLIIPLLLEDVTSEARYFPLASYQGVPCFDGNYAIALHKLLNSLPHPAISTVEITTEQTTQLRIDSRKAELAYLERLRLEELLNTDKYTPLAGSSEQYLRRQTEMRPIFELLPIVKDQPEREDAIGENVLEQNEPRMFEDAVAEIRRIRRAVLLGEPGCGKSTTIWRLASDLESDAINDRKAPIPLLIRLGRWTEPEQPLIHFIASQMGDLGDSLHRLLQDKRAVLLLDGLNELPAGQRDEKYAQVQKLMECNPELMTIVSCRELDYKIELGINRINIMPLDPPRIREFIVRYLGEEKGEQLFWKLVAEESRNCHDNFPAKFWQGHEENLWLVDYAAIDLNWTTDDYFENKYYYWDKEISNLWNPSSLMALARNPYMLLMLASVYAEQNELPENRGKLFRLFVETLLNRENISVSECKSLTNGLAQLAYEMQIRCTNDDSGNALTVLPKENVAEILGERLLYIAGSASILCVGEQVHFTHQLLQEYFAARYMDQEIRAGRLKATEIWSREKWWDRTNWEEAAILLAGFYSNDCSSIVKWVADATPEVAAMCVMHSGARLDESTAEQLRSKWVLRLTDLKGDPKPNARAAVGRALGMTGWDNRKGISVIVGRQAGLLPDIDWEEIPAGEFLYGAIAENAAKPQKLTLPRFYMARYQITFMQFKSFIEDPKGHANPRWFEGLAASEDDRRMQEPRFKFSNHPREMVNWYQAIAFCRWFSWCLGGGTDLKDVNAWAVRLPTEFEWEKAARGTDGRIYSYEGTYDTQKGNTDHELSRTVAVGIYPNGASPYQLMDMTGNGWEWCLSSFSKPAVESKTENLSHNVRRVLRGGSWHNIQINKRAVARGSARPNFRDDDIGFRLVCGVPPTSL